MSFEVSVIKLVKQALIEEKVDPAGDWEGKSYDLILSANQYILANNWLCQAGLFDCAAVAKLDVVSGNKLKNFVVKIVYLLL